MTNKSKAKAQQDPEQPLKNQRYEKMANLKVSGTKQEDCYQLTSKGRVKRSTAKVRASKIFNLPEVRARVLELTLAANKAGFIPETPPESPKRSNNGKSPTKRTLINTAKAKAGDALQLAETPQDIIKAVQVCRDLGLIQSQDEADKVDPTLILAHLCRYSGMPGDQVCRELGGIEYIIDKICALCKITRADILSVISPQELPADE